MVFLFRNFYNISILEIIISLGNNNFLDKFRGHESSNRKKNYPLVPYYCQPTGYWIYLWSVKDIPNAVLAIK